MTVVIYSNLYFSKINSRLDNTIIAVYILALRKWNLFSK